MYFHMYLFPRCLRMLIDAILVSTNTRTHTPSLSLSLRCLALPSSIYKALRRRNHDQSQYRFLRIRFSHFKGCTYTKICRAAWVGKLPVFESITCEGLQSLISQCMFSANGLTELISLSWHWNSMP